MFRLLPPNLESCAAARELAPDAHNAALATGLFRKQLVVLGRRPSAAPVMRGRVGCLQVAVREEVGAGTPGKSGAAFCARSRRRCVPRVRRASRPAYWRVQGRVHPCQPFIHCVGLADVRRLVPKMQFRARVGTYKAPDRLTRTLLVCYRSTSYLCPSARTTRSGGICPLHCRRRQMPRCATRD